MDTGGDDGSSSVRVPHTESAAFLLVQLGFHAARRLGERLAPLGIQPRQFGLLSSIAAAEGQSQQALGERLHLPKSRMVWLVDDLEQHGLAERRRNPTDRRAYALFLTPKGRRVLQEAMEVAAAHEAELLGGLQPAERQQLTVFLSRMAAAQGVLGNVFPGPPPGAKSVGDVPAEPREDV